MHTVDLAIVIGYLVLIVCVGMVFSRRVHDAGDYFLAGRSLTWGVIGLSIIGTNVSANGYVGASGGAYQLGIAQANFEWIGAIPAMILASLLFIPLYWRAGVYSIPEYLGRRYNKWVRVIAAGIASVFSIFAVAVALWAIAITLQENQNLACEMAGGAAGAPSVGRSCPKAVAERAMMTGSIGSPKYGGLSDAFHSIVREEGAAGLFRGMTPRLMTHTPAVAISWTAYEAAKRWLASAFPVHS